MDVYVHVLLLTSRHWLLSHTDTCTLSETQCFTKPVICRGQTADMRLTRQPGPNYRSVFVMFTSKAWNFIFSVSKNIQFIENTFAMFTKTVSQNRQHKESAHPSTYVRLLQQTLLRVYWSSRWYASSQRQLCHCWVSSITKQLSGSSWSNLQPESTICFPLSPNLYSNLDHGLNKRMKMLW